MNCKTYCNPLSSKTGLTEPQDNSGGKGPQAVSNPTLCPKNGQLWDQTRLLRAWSSGGLKPSMDN